MVGPFQPWKVINVVHYYHVIVWNTNSTLVPVGLRNNVMYFSTSAYPTASSPKTLNSRPIFFNSCWRWSFSLPKSSLCSKLDLFISPFLIFPPLFPEDVLGLFLPNSKHPNYSTIKFFKINTEYSFLKNVVIITFFNIAPLPISIIQSHECGR